MHFKIFIFYFLISNCCSSSKLQDIHHPSLVSRVEPEVSHDQVNDAKEKQEKAPIVSQVNYVNYD
jgi:hypothetical protein